MANSSEKRLTLLTAINSLLENPPPGLHDPEVAPWWAQAENVIVRWNPSKASDAKEAKSLFFAHIGSIGLDASKRHQGQIQMLTLLHQAKHDIETGEVAVTPQKVMAENVERCRICRCSIDAR
jgi:hypothetical protein